MSRPPARLPRDCALLVLALALALALAVTPASSALGQTNAAADIAQPGGFHDLSPFAKFFPPLLWSFSGIVLVLGATVMLLRYRLSTNLYKVSTDAHWQDDAQAEVGMEVEQSEVDEACADVGKAGSKRPAGDGETEAPEAVPNHQERLYTPASGPAWNEPMLHAFLASCLRANCLGRLWQEEAARRQVRQLAVNRLPDPREAELIRVLKARWNEFHVDPDSGIFVDHVDGGSGRSRVCLIEVVRQKHTVTHASLNAGMLIGSVGRYLQSTDVVYPGEAGNYHAPNKQELGALSAEDKKRLMRVKSIPNPWQAMIGEKTES